MKCRYVRGMECECNGDCNNCDMAGTVERSIKRKVDDDGRNTVDRKPTKRAG